MIRQHNLQKEAVGGTHAAIHGVKLTGLIRDTAVVVVAGMDLLMHITGYHNVESGGLVVGFDFKKVYHL